MNKSSSRRRFGRLATFAVAALGVAAVALPLSAAQAEGMYLGWDFGHGFGIGVGTPPSAYGAHYCGLIATYGPCWPYYR